MRLTLRELPVLACAAGHTYFMDPGFPIWLLNALVDQQAPKIPAGEKKGIVLKHYSCGQCSAPLPKSEAGRRSFSFELAWKDQPPVFADLDVPVFGCACGREQVRSASELEKLIPAALVHAFKAEAIKAPG